MRRRLERRGLVESEGGQSLTVGVPSAMIVSAPPLQPQMSRISRMEENLVIGHEDVRIIGLSEVYVVGL